ncbi:hypothetical protein TIFTF001_038949 [Ficus carica]|uniref:Uncharacterized protein n=1 Tax=Ficus carica TaxID=3494 RepID=A0AA88E9U9_FICCA|nr:hypothetical protein TIFTF001_038940 [Ficus carica]GMN69898.1 hypothetical protein TIFTF001_038943 [Ficus carica]GMN69899.1 hypothetical protein TIFTF001_038946 [Ficus carica]GMN69904.1 hypothetical protein TIFTF001_038949 [Ficus carica]
MRVRHLKLLASMSHPPSLHTQAPRAGHNKEPPQGTNTWIHFGEQHGLALLTWQAHALPKPHHDRPLEEATPLGLALMNPHSRLPSLAPLASQGLHTSP